METFVSLYKKAVSAAVRHKVGEEILDGDQIKNFDPHHLDCLLNPQHFAPVIRLGPCECDDEECLKACGFDAISKGPDGNAQISKESCVGCGQCVESCKPKNLTDRRDLLPVFELLQGGAPVFALIAPAFISQFSEQVTPGKLRSAFKQLGFEGMLEVALFADILTLKEALEFDRYIKTDRDFLLTSCCCPIWIAMIRKVYGQLIPHLTPSVSPMVACGRSVKFLHPEAKTVFIGPCIAKKAEAKEPDVKDAVDYVLTFQEVRDIFEIAGIDPAAEAEDLRDHSSKAGRLYARTGGVSFAVESTLSRLRPERKIPLKARQAHGVPACRAMLSEVQNGEISANFLEGMGCVGGCVGGPKAILPKEEGTVHVNRYAGTAIYETPADNPYVIELLQRLGFDSIEKLLQHDHFFIRDFSK